MALSLKQAQIALPIDELPTKWYNIAPDLPTKLPPTKGTRRRRISISGSGPEDDSRMPKPRDVGVAMDRHT
ncbi:MAG TPA: hypothetical protein VLV18_02675 [Terriglobales bacterium]|nr:hypothetical protein [Terriglobales bacterium]